MHPRTVLGLAAAVCCALVLGACSAGDGSAASKSGPRDTRVETFSLVDDPARSIPEVEPDRGQVLSAARLDTVLEQLLTEHSALAVQAMRAAADRSGDRGPAVDALLRNTTDLTGAIGLVYGPTGARAFDQLWKQHIQFFVDYADATGRHDDDARTMAMEHLHDYQVDFSSFTETATGGKASLAVFSAALHTHVQQLLAQVDAYAAGRYDLAVQQQDDARAHMLDIAAALAGAIAAQQPEQFPGAIDEPIEAADRESRRATLEQVQHAIDLAWSATYRPELVPALRASQLSPLPAGAFPGVDAALVALHSALATRSADTAADAAHRALAAVTA